MDKNIINTVKDTGGRTHVVFESNTQAGCLALLEV